ncbi:MAG: hypothetical protein QM750_11770 [Rubrivivax sp.]
MQRDKGKAGERGQAIRDERMNDMATKPAPKAKGKTQALPASVDDSERLADLALRPGVNAAAVMSAYAGPLGVKDGDVTALVSQLAEDTKDMRAGDMKRAEAMLFGQAHALQSIFMELARRATKQQYLKQWEAYLRMALKAQNQCRMTLETLATVKNPPVVFARQANINNGGQQQVNNGQPALAPCVPAENATAAPTELLGASDGKWLDARAAGAAGGADPRLAAVGEVHRPANR